MTRYCRILFAILALAPSRLPGNDLLFSSVIEPVFKKECSGCHGDGQTLGKLDLRTREGLLKGGTRGPAIVAGNARDSILYQALEGKGSLQMPPGGAEKKLPASVIAAVREWIDGGAPWPLPTAGQQWSYKDEDLWAFKPVAPRDKTKTIDAFLDGRLVEIGLKPSPGADRRTLIRRATLDLTGLPPAPEEVDAFVNDPSKDAWPRLIERLLASPRYGERWARHWLDVARYADSSGYSNDFERPNAWRYRDYVIRAFQNDKPYDRFIREQIAGDEINPGDPESSIATGFLRAGPWEHTGMSVEAVTRQMFLDDVTHGVASTFLGVTLGCARCHDHKFDPIPTRDYYRMQAVFATTEFARPAVPFLPTENTADLESGRAHLQEVVRRTQAAIEALTNKARRSALEKYGVERVEDLPAEVRQQIASVSKSSPLTEEEQEEAKLYRKHLQLYRESLDRYEPKAFAVSSGPLDGATDGGPNLRYPPHAKYMAPEVHILPGGNLQSPAEKVDPGVLGIVARYSELAEPEIPRTVAGRRTALANWIAHPDNPLTARVMVNRIWQYHFGQGIAADTSNVGKMGRKPSHPELLDWLAAYFVEQGWSVKAIHRAILLSNAYQRASAHPDMETARAKDPGNTLLAYHAARRVEAEVLRDSILAVSGELSSGAGGPGVFPQINEEVARQPRHTMGSVQPAYFPSPLKRQRNRRTVYTFQQRSLVDPMIEVFNGPSLDLSCERRESSTVPTQAFTLLNGQFVHDMALEFARRIEREARTAETRIERAFRLALGRAPNARETRLSREHIRKMTAHHRDTPAPPRAEAKPVVHTITSELTGQRFRFVQQTGIDAYQHNTHPSEAAPETRALADLALVLLNSNEFVYVD